MSGILSLTSKTSSLKRQIQMSKKRSMIGRTRMWHFLCNGRYDCNSSNQLNFTRSYVVQNLKDIEDGGGFLTPRSLPLLSSRYFSSEHSFPETKPLSSSKDLNPNEKKWRMKYQELLLYYKQHGHVDVPQKEGMLGQWVKNQRQGRLGQWVKQHQSQNSSHTHFSISRSPKDLLLEEKYLRLNELGFTWNAKLKSSKQSIHNHIRKEKKNDDELNLPHSLSSPSSNWEIQFKKLEKFQREHGHCNITRSDDRKLYNWIKRERYLYKKYLCNNHISNDNKHTQEIIPTKLRFQRCTDLGLEWDPFEKQWNEMFRQLQQYKEKFNDCLVPQQYLENTKLGHWVHLQRRIYKRQQQQKRNSRGRKGNYSTMLTPTRIQMLENLGFVWHVVSRTTWDDRYQQLDEIYKKNGHCNLSLASTTKREKYSSSTALIPTVTTDDKSLYRWYKQEIGKYWSIIMEDEKNESKYNGMNSRKYKERVLKLEKLGIDWNRYNALEFEKGIQNLMKYKSIYGDVLVPQSFEGMSHLSKWVMSIRKQYEVSIKKKGLTTSPLTVSQIDRLNDIGFVWNAEEAQWWNILKKFQHNQARGMTKDMQRNLSKLMMQQREWGSSNEFEPSIPSSHTKSTTKFLKMQDSQRQIMDLYSKSLVEDSDFDSQLKDEMSSTIPEKQINEKGDIDQWEQHFQSLKEFHNETGSTLVPSVYPKDLKLANWVMEQRKNFLNGTMARNHRDALEEVGFIFTVDHKVEEWEKFYSDLISFREEHGHCEVPLWYSPNPKLGSWLFAHQTQHSIYIAENNDKNMNSNDQDDNFSSSISRLHIKLLQDAGVSWHHQPNLPKS